MIQFKAQSRYFCCDEIPYTHTVSPKDSVLEKTVPGHFYRMVWRDSANGYTYYTTTDYDNECATERAMYRNYIVDSMAYWAKEYHVDGFSIDLISNVNTRRIETAQEKTTGYQK